MDTIDFVRLARIYQAVGEVLGNIPFQIGGESLYSAIITKRLEEKLYLDAPNACANDFGDVVEILTIKEYMPAVIDKIALGGNLSFFGTETRLTVFENVPDVVQRVKLSSDHSLDLRFVFCGHEVQKDVVLSQMAWPGVEMLSGGIPWAMQNPYSILVTHALRHHRNHFDDLAMLYCVDFLLESSTLTEISHILKQGLPVPLYIKVFAMVHNIAKMRDYL